MSVKYSDFFGCYFVIYTDSTTGKSTTKRCATRQEAENFMENMNTEAPPWYFSDRF